MHKRITAVLLISLLALLALAGTAQAATTNAFGLTYAGQQNCTGCHSYNGISQAYRNSRHGAFMAIIDPAKGGSLSLAVPAFDLPGMWPSPAGAEGGIQFNAQDLFLQVGAPGITKEYIGKYKGGDATTTAGSYIPPLSPSDDYPLFDPIAFSPSLDEWEPEGGPVITVAYFQRCGGCHNLGLTRPSAAAVTLGNGASITPTTPTAWSGLGIQCENCHGSGEASIPGHGGTGTKVLGIGVLASEACGQCHSSGTTVEKRLGTTSPFSNPNGYTPDEPLDDYFHVYTPADDIGSTNPRFYPSGANRSMNHVYYNEWNIGAHANSRASLKNELGNPFPSATADCVRCHSAEGYLKANGYDQTILAGYTPSPATDKYDIECAVCHNVHEPNSADPLSIRGGDEVCSTCHTAEIAEGTSVAVNAVVSWTPTQKEMVAGYGLIGVGEMGSSMGDATCVDCHMPETRTDRMSHSFKVMMPGDAAEWAATWPGRNPGDSCTPCHETMTRSTLQGNIDGWQAEFSSKLTSLKAAIASAKSTPAGMSEYGKALLAKADTNVAFLENDGSSGVHNMPYARAGFTASMKLVEAALAPPPTTTTTTSTTTTTLPTTTTTTMPTTTTTTTPTPPNQDPLFSDVPATHTFFTYIQGLGTMGAVDGYADGTFRPSALLTRAQAAKILVVAFDFHDDAWTNWSNPTFKDVPRPLMQTESARYPFDFVEEAFQNDVILGYADGNFRPYNRITRAQLALMIARIGGDLLAPATAQDRAHFTDLAGLGVEAKEAIAVCYANGIISGKTAATFDPLGTATRGQAAKMIFNLTQMQGAGS